jgi:hypothetical protein
MIWQRHTLAICQRVCAHNGQTGGSYFLSQLEKTSGLFSNYHHLFPKEVITCCR